MHHKIREALWVLKEKKIAVWGLTFKPDTEDVRSSVEVDVVSDLLGEGALGRNLRDPVIARSFGFTYTSIGRA